VEALQAINSDQVEERRNQEIAAGKRPGWFKTNGDDAWWESPATKWH
jgi:hypothetical protein